MTEDEKAARTAALAELTKLGELQSAAQDRYEKDNDAWWNNLSQKEREDAFYAVCKRIHRGDIIDGGSYRYVLYDVFGFDPGMYGAGMDCGYMAIHNAIGDGNQLQQMKCVDRVEVVDETGRAYMRSAGQVNRLEFSMQDNDCTLKMFVNSKNSLDL